MGASSLGRQPDSLAAEGRWRSTSRTTSRRRFSDDEEDLIQKAVGWMLREAGKADPARLERYLRQHGPAIPRTTVRYAIERFPPAKRLALLRATRT